jgi:transposase
VSDRLAGSQAALTATVDGNGDCVVAWLRDGAVVNGLFVKTLPGCGEGGAAEARIEVGRAFRAPSLFQTSQSTAVVFEVEDLSADGGVAFKPLPQR